MRRSGPTGLAVLLIAVAAAVLLVAAELSTYRSIEVLTASCEELTRSTPEVSDDCVTTGGEQHGWALLPIALLVLLMGWGAGPGRSRPAALALAAAGVVVALIAFVGDIPDVDVTGAVGRDFEQASGEAGPAIVLELIGAALALTAAGIRLATIRRAD